MLGDVGWPHTRLRTGGGEEKNKSISILALATKHISIRINDKWNPADCWVSFIIYTRRNDDAGRIIVHPSSSIFLSARWDRSSPLLMLWPTFASLLFFTLPVMQWEGSQRTASLHTHTRARMRGDTRGFIVVRVKSTETSVNWTDEAGSARYNKGCLILQLSSRKSKRSIHFLFGGFLKHQTEVFSFPQPEILPIFLGSR